MVGQVLRKIGLGVLIALLGLALLAAGWLAYLQLLNRTYDTACPEPPPVTSGMDPQLQAVLNSYTLGNDGIGLQATVILTDGSLLAAVAGDASREKGCPMTPDHLMFTGSITKLYVAALVMAQAEQGTLNLDDSLDNWLDLPYAGKVTVRQLLDHSSGIPNYTEDLWFRLVHRFLPWKEWTSDELLRIIRRQTLSSTPGSRYAYSSANYILLAKALERASGQPFDQLLQEALLSKVGLQDTYFGSYSSDLPIANGYDRSLFRWLPFRDTSQVTGLRPSLSSNVLATSSDVARFTHRLFSGQLLAPVSLGAMTDYQPAPEPSLPEQRGYGLGISSLVLGLHEFAGHTGLVPGYSAIALHSTTAGYTIVILSNLSPADLGALAIQIADMAGKRQKQ